MFLTQLPANPVIRNETVDPISKMEWRHAKELLLIVNNCTAVRHAINDLKPEYDN